MSIHNRGISLEPPNNTTMEKTPKLLTESMIRRKSPRIDVRDAGEMLMRSVSLVYSRRQDGGKNGGDNNKGGDDNKNDEEKRKEVLKKAQDKMKKYVENDTQTVLGFLNVHPDQGLSSSQIEQLRSEYGLNELERDPPTPFWKAFLAQFSDLLVIMLIVAAIVSMALGDYEASATIILIVMLNAILGVVQERKAGQALAALEAMSSPTCEVIRGGQRQTVDSNQLLPGDIVFLESGNRISADIRLIESQQLSANEMPLTGESDGVAKDANFVVGKTAGEESKQLESARGGDNNNNGGAAGDNSARNNSEPDQDEKKIDKTATTAAAAKKEKKEESLTDKNMVYMGCSIMDGRGKGVVVAIGMRTKMGEIAALIKDADSGDTPLQEKLQGLGKRLGMASLAVSIIVFVIGVATGRGAEEGGKPVWLQMLLIAVSLTVAAVPEGLPACVTITLAVGMHHMVKKNALIRNLKSVETLGSATVICTDKTGTLTLGKMTAVKMWCSGEAFSITGEGYSPVGEIFSEASDGSTGRVDNANIYHPLLMTAVLCCNAEPYVTPEGEPDVRGSSTERPLVVLGLKAGIDGIVIRKKYPRLHENPFNSTRKMMSVLVDVRGAMDNTNKQNGASVVDESNGTKKNNVMVLQDVEEKHDGSTNNGTTGSGNGAKLNNNNNNNKNHQNGTGGSVSDASFFNSPYVACVKGAPHQVLEACIATVNDKGQEQPLTDSDRQQILSVIDGYSSQALRVLAIAYQKFDEKPSNTKGEFLERQLVLTGLIASMDPVRPEVSIALVKAANAGIRTVMITGDYVKTAEAIGKKIGLLDDGPSANNALKAIDCAVIRDVQIEIDEVEKRLKEAKDHKMKDRVEQLKQKRHGLVTKLDSITAMADVYARAKPVDKITIVRSLQRQGHVCAMTGDGVNDAPALKQANIGVAMGKCGTDVAKAASDMVLTDDNYASIVSAVEEGRVVYQNISKFVYFLLSTNVSEVFTILIAVLIGVDSPLVPIQILWLNLTTDGFPAIALALEELEPDVMDEGPRLLTESIIDRTMVTGIVIQTITLTGSLLILYFYCLNRFTGSWMSEYYQFPENYSYGGINYNCAPSANTTAYRTVCDIRKSQNDILFNLHKKGVEKAQSMVILCIVTAELLRAYGARSIRNSIFRIGTNWYMHAAVVSSLALTYILFNIPAVRESVFKVEELSGNDWGIMFGFAFIPITVDEITKFIYYRTGYGKRGKITIHTGKPGIVPQSSSGGSGSGGGGGGTGTGKSARVAPSS